MKVKKAKAAPVRRTAGISILCVLISLLACLTIGLQMVRSLTSAEHIQASVENALMDVDLTQVPAADLMADADGDESIAAYIAREIEKNYVIDVEVDEADVQKFLEDSTIIPFIAKEISALADDVRSDGRKAGITERDISRLMWENQEQIEQLVGTELKQKDVDNVISFMEKEGVMEELNVKTIKADEPEVFAGLQVLLSDVTIIVLLVLILGLAVLIVMGYRWNVCRGCGSVGMALMVSGGIFLLLCGAAYVLAAAWSSMISYLIRMVLSGSLLSAVVFFVLGAIGVAVDRITRKQV